MAFNGAVNNICYIMTELFIFAEATGIPLQTTNILQATETFYLINFANFGGDRY